MTLSKIDTSVLSKVDRGLLNLNATATEYKNKAQEFLEKGDIAKAMQNRTVANKKDRKKQEKTPVLFCRD